MVKDVWSLKLGRDILGVRVLTQYGKYYDIDIDVYKKQLKLDPSTLKSLALMEYGDLFMTDEEFNSGVLIEDASENTGILNGVNTFVRSNMKDDPVYLAKRRKKVEEISQKYYSYMPREWLKEFAEYHLDNFDGNANIYSTLSKEQLTIVKDYFRWRSRVIFDEQQASKLLRTKMNKAKELVALMGNATDWYYDGTVDTGYAGGSHCELGHALRYEHYAVSPSLNKQIVFGATCMSDFFEVDKKVLDEITKAQEILLKEIKAIVFIRQTGRYEDYAKDYAKDLWDVLKFFKGQFNEKIPNGAGWSRFIGGFHKSGLPLTRSLLHKFYDLVKKQKKEIYDAEVDAKEAKRESERATRQAYVKTIEDSIDSDLDMKSQFADQEAESEAQAMRDAFDAREERSSEQSNENKTNETSRAPSNAPLSEEAKLEMTLMEIEKARDEGRLVGNFFAFTIIPSIRKQGWMSAKQKGYIDEALAKIQPEKHATPAPTSVRSPASVQPSKEVEKPTPVQPPKEVEKPKVIDDDIDYSSIF